MFFRSQLIYRLFRVIGVSLGLLELLAKVADEALEGGLFQALSVILPVGVVQVVFVVVAAHSAVLMPAPGLGHPLDYEY